MNYQSLLYVGFVVAMLGASIGELRASCATPLRPPQSYDRLNWRELEDMAVDAGLNPLVQKVQQLKDNGHGKLNTDYYSITVDASGDQAHQLFATLRADLNRFIFDGTSYSLSPYDNRNAAIWNSDQPKGAVMTFVLAGIAGVNFEKGSVIVSCISPADLVFSTITTAKDGLHPVAGNRAFGVYAKNDGSLTIFTKAADRVINEGGFGHLNESGRELLFEQGDNVWLGFIANIKNKMQTRNPRAEVRYSKRVDY